MFSRRNRVVLSCAVLLVAAVTATAQNTTSYTKVLLPVSPSTVSGANNAQWITQLTISNADASPVSLFCFTGECSPIEARTAQRLEASPSATGGPGLLYIPTDSARRLTLALRSRNTTPNSDERDFISAIPVVRESEFRSSTIELPAVPIEANYRHMLRIFDANANEEGRVRVRVWGMQNGRIVTNALIDTEITLRTARGTASPFARPDEPAVAALGNFSDQSGVRDFPEVHIRIEALSNNMELWALATATNNTTQRFAVYTP